MDDIENFDGFGQADANQMDITANRVFTADVHTELLAMFKKFNFPTTLRSDPPIETYRTTANLILRLEGVPGVPDYSRLTKPEGVAWSTVFGLPAFGSRGVTKDRAAAHFAAYFATPDVFLKRDSVSMFHVTISCAGGRENESTNRIVRG